MSRSLRRKQQKVARNRTGKSPDAALARADQALQAKQWDKASGALRDVLKVRPDHVDSWINLGALHIKAGEAQKAGKALKRALELQPKSVPALANLANLKKQLGDNEAATGLYRQALALAPENAQLWYELTLVKKFQSRDADFTAMENLRKSRKLSDRDRMHTNYALGKALEDIGDFDATFACLAEANGLRRSAVHFDIETERAMFDRLIKIFDTQFLADHSRVGNDDERAVFVLGMPRSGTSLIEQILASHSDVFGAGERSYLSDVLADAVPGFPEAATLLTGSSFQNIGKAYVERLTKLSSRAKRITDKMPRNFLFVGMLAVILPRARIIHCRRSPMDTCFSCFALHFPYGQEFSYDLAELGAYYRLYRRLMEHWHRVLPGRILDVTYEQVVADPEPQARRLAKFCGLKWQDACLDFHKNKRQVITASATQVREPVHSRSVARWKRFADHLVPLAEALGDDVDEG